MLKQQPSVGGRGHTWAWWAGDGPERSRELILVTSGHPVRRGWADNGDITGSRGLVTLPHLAPGPPGMVTSKYKHIVYTETGNATLLQLGGETWMVNNWGSFSEINIQRWNNETDLWTIEAFRNVQSWMIRLIMMFNLKDFTLIILNLFIVNNGGRVKCSAFNKSLRRIFVWEHKKIQIFISSMKCLDCNRA